MQGLGELIHSVCFPCFWQPEKTHLELTVPIPVFGSIPCPRGGSRHRSPGWGTHVGPGEGAPAAALIRLLVAPQLAEGTGLAEQGPDVLAI